MRTKTMRLIFNVVFVLSSLGYALFIATRPLFAPTYGQEFLVWIGVLFVAHNILERRERRKERPAQRQAFLLHTLCWGG